MKNELLKAQYLWSKLTQIELRDNRLLQTTAPPKQGWIQFCRESLQISQETMAEKLKISKQAFSKFEKNEREKTVSLRSLEAVAESMDCELVYILRPKNRNTFTEILWEQCFPKAQRLYNERSRSQHFRPTVLATLAQQVFRDPEFRRKMRWAQNSSTSLKG